MAGDTNVSAFAGRTESRAQLDPGILFDIGRHSLGKLHVVTIGLALGTDRQQAPQCLNLRPGRLQVLKQPFGVLFGLFAVRDIKQHTVRLFEVSLVVAANFTVKEHGSDLTIPAHHFQFHAEDFPDRQKAGIVFPAVLLPFGGQEIAEWSADQPAGSL